MSRVLVVGMFFFLLLPQFSSRAFAQAKGALVQPVIIGVQGEATVRRPNRSGYAAAVFGMGVQRGDLLRLRDGASLTILCGDGNLVTAKRALGAVPCAVLPDSIWDNTKGIRKGVRGTAATGSLIIMAPRATSLLSPHPLLRWTPLAGVSTYTVTVLKAGATLSPLWSQQVESSTELRYPENAPALTPGTAYLLRVEAGNRSSDEEGTEGRGFTLLPAATAENVRSAEERIRALRLPEPTMRFLIAMLYSTNGLQAEAIEQLEAIPEASREPAMERVLGNAFLSTGLLRDAEKRYLAALASSQRLKDSDGEATAEYMLALIYGALGNQPERLQHLQRALTLYQSLGDAPMEQQLRQQLPAPP